MNESKETIKQDVVATSITGKRSPIGAAILGLFFPGLGFLYGGNTKLAVYPNVVFVFLTFIVGWFLVKESPTGMYLNLILIIVWIFSSSIGAYVYVSLNRKVVMSKHNRFLYYLLFIFCIIIIQYSFGHHRAVLLGYDTTRVVGNIGTSLVSGDFVVIDTEQRELNVGDIAVYNGTKSLSLSTMIEKKEDGFLFNNIKDLNVVIPKGDIVGKPIYIWYSQDFDTHKPRWERFPSYIQADAVSSAASPTGRNSVLR